MRLKRATYPFDLPSFMKTSSQLGIGWVQFDPGTAECEAVLSGIYFRGWKPGLVLEALCD